MPKQLVCVRLLNGGVVCGKCVHAVQEQQHSDRLFRARLQCLREPDFLVSAVSRMHVALPARVGHVLQLEDPQRDDDSASAAALKWGSGWDHRGTCRCHGGGRDFVLSGAVQKDSREVSLISVGLDEAVEERNLLFGAFPEGECRVGASKFRPLQ